MNSVQAWLKSGAYLPKFMRDFHDQKNLFKCINEIKGDKEPYSTWRDEHIYTIDNFLWFMARHGYVLTKSRTKLDFADIDKRLLDFYNAEQELSAKMINEMLAQDREPK